jgi:outer membrane protein assembly factor BamD
MVWCKTTTALALLGLLIAGCGGYPDDIDLESGLNESDALLYSRALHDLDRGQNTRARLLFQTLTATYPDSEFMPQAKYGWAETYFQAGTMGDLAQAAVEFREFITFFPTHELADDAQLLVAMTHVRMMEKPDRDPTHALLAEAEMERFIDQYPDSDHGEEVREKLRSVKEILAEGEMRVANYYLTSGNFLGAVSRYLDILDKYPDYSDIAETLFRLGETMRRGGNQGEAIVYYNRVIRDHPLSEVVEDATTRLAELDQPIPEANPVALARAEAAPPPPKGKGVFARVFGLWSRRPDVSTETTAASLIDDAEGREGPGAGEPPTFEVEGTVIGAGSPE